MADGRNFLNARGNTMGEKRKRENLDFKD